jgi:hypothetical protein
MVGTPLSHCQQPWISEGNENSNVWFVYKCRTFFICLVSSHVTSARTERPRSGRAAMIRQRNWKCSLLSSRMMIRCEKAVFDHHKPRHHARLGASRCEPCEYALQLTAGARRRGRGPAFSVEGGREGYTTATPASRKLVTLPSLVICYARGHSASRGRGWEREKRGAIKAASPRPVAFSSALGSCR